MDVEVELLERGHQSCVFTDLWPDGNKRAIRLHDKMPMWRNLRHEQLLRISESWSCESEQPDCCAYD